jgi:hypothetical protein
MAQRSYYDGLLCAEFRTERVTRKRWQRHNQQTQDS